MNCQEVAQQLSEYLDGDLGDCQCSEIAQHFEECEDCQKLYASFKHIIEICKDCMKVDMPTDIRTRLRTKLKGEYKSCQEQATE